MAWNQIKQPNLDPYIYQGGTALNDWLGWCLAYVQSAYGIGWAGNDAWEAWSTRTVKKHTDRSMPSGVWVPVWFEHWGTYNGVYKNWGHVALYKDGQISSSPISHKPFADVWGSIEAIESNYHCKFVGWSEDVSGTDVAQFVADQVTAPMAGHQRRVSNDSGVNGREAPNTSAAIKQEFAKDDVLDFKGFVHGENVSANDIWFVGALQGRYFWSGAFEGGKDTSNLNDLTPEAEAPAPVVPKYTFTKDLDCVTEVIPAATGNFEYGRFPDKPAKVVMHDFGTPNKDTVTSVINHFTGNGVEVSAHFVVSGDRIIQMVSLHDRAYHAGPTGNDFIGIELDPIQDAATVESGKKLLKALREHYGYKFELVEHNQIMNTLCGDDINLADYEIDPPVVPIEVPVESPVETPVVVAPVPSTGSYGEGGYGGTPQSINWGAILKAIINFIVNIFKKRK